MDNDGPTSNDIITAYLKKVLEHVLAAGHSVREFSEFVLNKFGAACLPNLRQFLSDVSTGDIKVKGLTAAAKTAIVGHHVSAEEHDAMVREEAYYRSEQRGFAAGHEVEDWVAAEAEIDSRLAEEAGLIARGGKALALTATNIEKELKKLKGSVTTWLEENYAAVNKTATTGDTSRKKAAGTGSAVNKVSSPKKVRAKTAAQAKKTVAKTSAKKVSAQKKTVKKEPA